MAFITSNQLAMAGGIPTAAGIEGAAPSFIEGAAPSGIGATSGAASAYTQPSDAVTFGPHAPLAPAPGEPWEPLSFPGEGGYDPIGTAEGGFTGGSGGGWSFSGIMNQIGNALNGIFNQLGSFLSSLTGGSTQPSSGETFYSNAAANSVGDPHLSFDGTTGAGTNVNDKWNDMGSHADLLDSDSFAGGYRVSTTATAPDSNGITYNASATVSTGGGAATVTMNANGSYAVSEDGRPITLQTGDATQLGDGETVTLDANGALTIADRNEQGGTLTTTLASNGKGVDVSNSAQDVDLGGYLVNRSDADPAPVAQSGASQTPWYVYGGQPSYGSLGEPTVMAPTSLAANVNAFDPDAQGTSLQSIELQ